MVHLEVVHLDDTTLSHFETSCMPIRRRRQNETAPLPEIGNDAALYYLALYYLMDVSPARPNPLGADRRVAGYLLATRGLLAHQIPERRRAGCAPLGGR